MNRDVEGMTIILAHCRFRWFEPAGGEGRRIFLIKRKHCQQCVEELMQRWPSSIYLAAAVEDTDPGPAHAA